MPDEAVAQRSPIIAFLEERDIHLAVQLSTAAGWNQTASDWRMLARLYPDGCFGIHSGGNLVATATLIRHGGRLGDASWLSAPRLCSSTPRPRSAARGRPGN